MLGRCALESKQLLVRVRTQAAATICSQPQPHVLHWLDRLLPGAREWLDGKNREWWLKGVQARCRTLPALKEHQKLILFQLEQQFQDLFAKHRSKAIDERASTHLQVACLLLATQRVLRPFVRNSMELHDILQDHMGQRISPALRFLLKCSLYLTQDPVQITAKRLKGLQLDYGHAFQPQLTPKGRGQQLVIGSCLYHSFLEEEKSLDLLPCCCCTQDRMWFEGLEKFGVQFKRSAWLGSSDGACCLQVSPAENNAE